MFIVYDWHLVSRGAPPELRESVPFGGTAYHGVQSVDQDPDQQPPPGGGTVELLVQEAQLVHGVVGGVRLLHHRGRGGRGGGLGTNVMMDCEGERVGIGGLKHGCMYLSDVELSSREGDLVQQLLLILNSLPQHIGQMLHAANLKALSALFKLIIETWLPPQFLFVAVVHPLVHLRLHGVAGRLHGTCMEWLPVEHGQGTECASHLEHVDLRDGSHSNQLQPHLHTILCNSIFTH